MGMKTNSNVQEFKFQSLSPTIKAGQGEVEEFKFSEIDSTFDHSKGVSENIIRLEREHEAKSPFEISPVVKEHRGLSKQAEQDFENRLQVELEKRLEAIHEEAFAKGFEQGRIEGHELAHNEAKQQFESQVDECAQIIHSFKQHVQEQYHSSKDDIYRMVKNLTKWIVLKEVDEKYYLARLLEKLIHEINTKSGLVLHVNEKAFGHMPEIIKIVERKVGVLTNVRIEVDLDLDENGIVLESENTIIDGSLDAQFKSLDKLFTSVGLHGEY